MDDSLRIRIERDGERYRVFTSLNGNIWTAVCVTFPEPIDAREVASALCNASDAEHIEIIDETKSAEQS